MSTRSRQLTAVLGLFILTLALAALTLLGDSLSTSSAHMTGVEIFTELAGAGTLLSGIGAMLAVFISYVDRRRKGGQDSSLIRELIARMDRPLKPEDLDALADFTRALNGNEGSPRKDKIRQIEPDPPAKYDA